MEEICRCLSPSSHTAAHRCTATITQMSRGVAPAPLLLPPVSPRLSKQSPTLSVSVPSRYPGLPVTAVLCHTADVSVIVPGLTSFELASLVSSRAWRKTAAARACWITLASPHPPPTFTPLTPPSGRQSSRIDSHSEEEKRRIMRSLCFSGTWNLSLEAAKAIRSNVPYCKPHAGPANTERDPGSCR